MNSVPKPPKSAGSEFALLFAQVKIIQKGIRITNGIDTSSLLVHLPQNSTPAPLLVRMHLYVWLSVSCVCVCVSVWAWTSNMGSLRRFSFVLCVQRPFPCQSPRVSLAIHCVCSGCARGVSVLSCKRPLSVHPELLGNQNFPKRPC